MFFFFLEKHESFLLVDFCFWLIKFKEREGRKCLSVFSTSWGRMECVVVIFTDITSGSGIVDSLPVMGSRQIHQSAQWTSGHFSTSEKGVTFPLLLTGCGSFCRDVHFILVFFFFKEKPEISISYMKFPDFKTLAGHVEYLLNNVIVKLSTSVDKFPPRTPGCYFCYMQATNSLAWLCFFRMEQSSRFCSQVLLRIRFVKSSYGWSLWLG